MKSVWISIVLIVGMAGALRAGDAAGGGSGPWTGWIVDSRCGAKNANPQGKDCAQSCVKNGAKFVLYVDPGGQLLGLADQALAGQHVGHRVRVTGEEGDAGIKIHNIEAVDMSDTTSPAHAGTAKEESRKLKGTVSAISESRIDVSSGKQAISLAVDHDTSYLKGKVALMLSDIQVGQRVTVVFVESGDSRTAREVRLEPAPAPQREPMSAPSFGGHHHH